MAESLGERLLGPGWDSRGNVTQYLEYLAGQSVEHIQSVEPQILSQASHSLLVSTQALSKKSHKALVEAAASHTLLGQIIPSMSRKTQELMHMVPRLDDKAETFSAGFSKASESKVINDRKRALCLSQNSERLVDVMELPSLLNSAIRASPVNYASTLDIHAHICRLASLYPASHTIVMVRNEADIMVRQMAADLMAILQTPHLKLAVGLRTMGWLRRIVPDITSQRHTEAVLPATFLICRFVTLILTLDALEPLKRLADEERSRDYKTSPSWSDSQHTERYLKRFIEVFREHSFNIVSVCKSVDASFPTVMAKTPDPLHPLPAAMSSFPLRLAGLLMENLQLYLPNLKDGASRDSILTQVLYCAGSLGRLGADFGALLSCIGPDDWAELVRRHRLLAGRLDSVIGENRSTQK